MQMDGPLHREVELSPDSAHRGPGFTAGCRHEGRPRGATPSVRF
jgi:hypothetical protein